ncbi:aldehyde dehydrogenase [Leucobacter luti]|uniref:aldehyde dehydrogenase (NAD(+)) n=1 Tax=Leucobacter luti TaxID=340320 RepID=A0A4Q7U171_9MICO|nr:aldehyde dehydrogenase [Leucobacter luti]MBL3699493.1 aldehyde dehydrogenase [Leucobacter luti]RZT67003.1 aldehyde dehydrogenase (NAD+)/geranial dehydrogenase [Leucobacter luti]
MHKQTLFIGGKWQDAADRDRFSVHDSNTEQVFGSFPLATESDIDAAVAAARGSLDDGGSWGGYSAYQRAAVMRRFADAIERRREEVGKLISREVGTPIARSTYSNADTAASLLRFYASVIEDTSIEDLRPAATGYSIVRREAIGVVGMIAPWNYPLSTLFFKLAPALAAGCTAVIKPASFTALDSYIIAEAVIEADMPPGVINIVPCSRETGDYLVAHPGIQKIAFTGSTPVGRKIGRTCGETLKPVTLELGGKSAALLLEDVPLDTFIADLADLSFSNNGQTCTNNSRLIVPESRYDEIVDAIATEVASWRVGDSLDPAVEMGPVVSAAHQQSLENYYEIAKREGGRVVVGGAPLDRTGFFVAPSVFADVTPEMTLFREELFGPAISITRYSGDPDEGVRLVNDSEYGLSGAVYTADETVGLELARRLETGTVCFNMYNFDIGAPFGGRKDSGIGFELGAEAIMAYLHFKTIFTPTVPAGF